MISVHNCEIMSQQDEEMNERHCQLIHFLRKIETPRSLTTIENTAQIVDSCLDALEFARCGAVQLTDLLRVPKPHLMLSAGSAAVFLGLDSNLDSFIKSVVGLPPTDASVRAINAMLKFKTFEFTAAHLCLASKSGWSRNDLSAIGRYIVQQTKHGLLDGNVAAVVAIMWPERCGNNIFFPGRSFEKHEWCCNEHWKAVNSDLPALMLPTPIN